MKVLFHCRPNLFEHQGGDRTQIEGTKRGLEVAGVQVDVTVDRAPTLAGYDLVHVFNPALVPADGVVAARRRGTPIVISTIYWPMAAYFRSYAGFAARLVAERVPGWPAGSLDAALRYAGYSWLWRPYHEHSVRRILRHADLLLPNSNAEAAVLREHLGIDVPSVVVPNAADIAEAVGVLPPVLKDVPAFVLSVGRLELRKNQHLLVDEVPATYPLVFVGNRRVNRAYAALVETLAARRGNVYFIDQVDRSALPAIYRAARVHALPSWYETPGLASLEAAVFGAAVVTTDEGGTREYFGADAHYCHPARPGSTGQAVRAAWATPPARTFATRIRETYTWEAVGRLTKSAYAGLR